MVEVPIVDALDEVPPPASPSSSSLFAPRFLLPATEEAPVVAASTWETLPPAPVAESPTVRIEDLSPPGRSKAKTPEPARPAAVRSASLPPRQRRGGDAPPRPAHDSSSGIESDAGPLPHWMGGSPKADTPPLTAQTAPWARSQDAAEKQRLAAVAAGLASQQETIPIAVPKPKKKKAESVAQAPPRKRSAAPVRLWFGRRKPAIPLREITTFTRQLAVMVHAGMPLHASLHFFSESIEEPLGPILSDLATRISSGFRLSGAMALHPEAFSEVYTGLVEMGESTSHLDESLTKLSDMLEKQLRLTKKLSSALVYPAFLVLVCLAAIAVFLQVVLPTLVPLFASFTMELPLPTRMLLHSRSLVWPLVVLGVGGWAGWLVAQPYWQRARRERAEWARKVDRLSLRIPVLGKFLQQLSTARVLFALATMLESGLPLLNALKRCETVAANLEMGERIRLAGKEMREGMPVSEGLALHRVLPTACTQLLAVGEESAKLSDMVQYAARFYEEEIDHAVDQFMNLVEPVIMIVMGLVVGFIVLAATLPTVEMINHLNI